MVEQWLIGYQNEEAEVHEIKKYWVNSDFGYKKYMIQNSNAALSY